MNINSTAFSLDMASFQTRTFSAMLGAGVADGSFMSVMTGQLQQMNALFSNPLAGLASPSRENATATAGRNMALADPESAYGMMTEINRRDVTFKAQSSELQQMSSQLAVMEKEGSSLSQVSSSAAGESIKADLQQFVGQYNDWIARFDADLHPGGLLADTSAAQIAQYELEQSVKYGLNGARDGLHGLRDLGVTIDPGSHMASLDAAKLDAVLASNRQGVVDTVREFSANFSRAAELLNAKDSFMPRQLDNLSRAIGYIAGHKADLQAEFGSGDAARPVGQVAAALANYNSNKAH